MKHAVWMVIQFFAGFGIYVPLHVTWWVLNLPYETDRRQGDVIYSDLGATAWRVTLGSFALCQILSYLVERRYLSAPSSQ